MFSHPFLSNWITIAWSQILFSDLKLFILRHENSTGGDRGVGGHGGERE